MPFLVAVTAPLGMPFGTTDWLSEWLLVIPSASRSSSEVSFAMITSSSSLISSTFTGLSGASTLTVSTGGPTPRFPAAPRCLRCLRLGLFLRLVGAATGGPLGRARGLWSTSSSLSESWKSLSGGGSSSSESSPFCSENTSRKGSEGTALEFGWESR